jgi:hypothetical protein
LRASKPGLDDLLAYALASLAPALWHERTSRNVRSAGGSPKVLKFEVGTQDIVSVKPLTGMGCDGDVQISVFDERLRDQLGHGTEVELMPEIRARRGFRLYSPDIPLFLYHFSRPPTGTMTKDGSRALISINSALEAKV